MDINFHYFAVKVIAVMAGYSNQDAEDIAEYSQFVDDYFDNNSFSVSNPPPFYTPIYDSGRSKVQSVQTGIETVKSLGSGHQRKVIIPFHFIPPMQLSRAGEGYRTTPAQWGGADHQLIVQMLETLTRDYSSHAGFKIFLGLLLHIFADTYAHQTFNGFHNKNINDGRVIRARENQPDGSSREKSYGAYSGLPAIGHADLGTAPDETALTYTCMRDMGSGRMVEQPERLNAYVFIQCAHEILKILRAARHSPAPGGQEFQMLDGALARGFLISCSSSISQLCDHWRANVPQINGTRLTYGYDARAVHNNLFTVNEEKLPQAMTVGQVYDLLEKISQPEREEEGGAEKLAEAHDCLNDLTALGAVSPTNAYYYFNACAYGVRELVNG